MKRGKSVDFSGYWKQHIVDYESKGARRRSSIPIIVETKPSNWCRGGAAHSSPAGDTILAASHSRFIIASAPWILASRFPWLPTGVLRHQTKFSFNFGRATIDIDGAKDSQAEGRTDVLVRWNEIPLVVLELKRKGIALTASDVEQGLSYASVIRPR